MDVFTISFWVLSIILLLITIRKDKEQAFESMKKSRGMMKNMIGDIIGIIFLIGFILTIIPPDTIQKYLGSDHTLFSGVIAAGVGSVTLIPAFVAFPLVGSLVDSGASVVVAVSFLTTLTMVGFVTFPLEKKEFGFKYALLRNGFSFIFAIIIALLVGGII